MPHVFVETNWLFDYAAPAHHQAPAAVDLLDRARSGEFTLHVPNLCFGEVRQPILTRCQPRREGDAIREFLTWAQSRDQITGPDAMTTRLVLDKYENKIKQDLAKVDGMLRILAGLPYLQVFGLDDAMLQRATELSLGGVALKPFDQAILAGVLVRASRLWDSGERSISFCELDKDLQPWDSSGNSKPLLTEAFDQSHVWVYKDFTLTQPPRRPGFE